MSPRVLDCTEVRRSLPLYSGGDLHPDRQAALDRHLSSCADCRMHAVRANSAREALVGGFTRERPGGVDLWAGLRDALVDQGVLLSGARPAPTPTQPPLRRAAPWRRWVPIGTAAAAALLAGLWIQRSFSGPGAVQPGPIQITPADALVVERPDEITPITPELVVTPVPVKDSDSPGLLRRVQPGEPRWGDAADVFEIQPSPMSQLSPWSPNTGSPVSLQRVRPDRR